MITLIQNPTTKQQHADLMEYFKLRKRVFHDQLKWKVSVIGDMEVDGYDAFNPLYVLSKNEHGQVVGGLRLLPTLGPNMLNDTFSQLLPNQTPIKRSDIWESSRFVVDHEREVYCGEYAIGYATAELGLTLNDIGKQQGLSQVVTVYAAAMHRMLRSADCAGEPISKPQKIGCCFTYAVAFDIGEGKWQQAEQIVGKRRSNIECLPLFHKKAA